MTVYLVFLYFDRFSTDCKRFEAAKLRFTTKQSLPNKETPHYARFISDCRAAFFCMFCSVAKRGFASPQ
jgi:hypothetical protein